MRRTLWMGVLVLLALPHAGNAQTIRRSGHHTLVRLEKHFQVSGQGKLRVLGPSADIRVIGWGENEVTVRQTIRLRRVGRKEAQEIARLAKSSFSRTGDEITIDDLRLPHRNVSMLYDIRVPRGFALKLVVDGGDVTVEEVNGDLRARTSGGDVQLRRLGGAVDVATSGGDIVAEQLAGSSRLRSSGGDVTVRRAIGRLTVRTSGGNIELRHLKGPTLATTSGGDIRVIGSADELRVKTGGGDIHVEDVQGFVKASSSGGDVRVISCCGKVFAETSGGNVHLRWVGETRVTTSGGDVLAENISTGIRASTSGGDVTLRKVDGYIEARTSGGDISAELTPSDSTVDHHVRLSAAGGDIRLALPEDLPATVHATIETLYRDLDAYRLESDFPIKITRRRQGSHSGRGEIRGEGDINGGGDLIELHTVEGNIKILLLP